MQTSNSSQQQQGGGNIASAAHGSSGPTKNFTLSPYAAAFVPSALRNHPPSASSCTPLISYSRPEWRSYRHQTSSSTISSAPEGTDDAGYHQHHQPHNAVWNEHQPQHQPTMMTDNKCSCKLLVTHKQAGAIIGKNGSEIAHIEQACKVSIKVSSSGSFFPGTMERVMVIFGVSINIRQALEDIIAKFEYCNEILQVQEETKSPYFRNEYNTTLSLATAVALGDVGGGGGWCKATRPVTMRLIVPNSAIGVLMGQHGSDIKRLAVGCGVHIQISSRINGLVERIVSVTGRSGNVLVAACEIMDAIQDNPHLLEHAINLTYSQQQHRAARAGTMNTQPSCSYHGASVSTVSSSNDSYNQQKNTMKSESTTATTRTTTSCCSYLPLATAWAPCCPPTSGHDKEEDSSQPLIGQLQLVIDALLMSLNDGDTNGRLIITSDDDDDMQLNLLALKGEP